MSATNTSPAARRPVLSTQASRAAIRRDHMGQVAGRLAVRQLHIVSTAVEFVRLDDARTFADDLWNGAVEAGSQWSSRKTYVAKLHTLVYQLLTEIAGRNVATVAIETRGAQ